MSDEAMDWLMGSGGKYFSFPAIGTTIEGVVLAIRKEQEKDINGELKTWPDGNPRYQAVVDLQTQLNDAEDDDGVRRIYLKTDGLRALREAFRDARLSGSPIGGTLKVRYSADKPMEKRGHNPMKLFIARFTPAPPKPKVADSWEDDSERQPGQDDSEPPSVGDDDIPF